MSQEEIFINGELLRLRREAQGWVLNDMATRACMSVKQIRQLEEGGMSSFYSVAVKATAAKKVGALLGLSAEEVFSHDAAPTNIDTMVEAEPEAADVVADLEAAIAVESLVAALIEGHVREVLELVELSGFGKKFPWQLSGGMQQRASIARALALDADILLMDEPFGALDALTRAKLQDELLEIVARTQSTVVMVTHDVDEAVLLSDKIVMMTNGPAATIGEVLSVDLPRPRQRVELAESADYQRYRKAVIDFLYTRQAHVEKTA